jgi:outer membrane protein TolC
MMIEWMTALFALAGLAGAAPTGVGGAAEHLESAPGAVGQGVVRAGIQRADTAVLPLVEVVSSALTTHPTVEAARARSRAAEAGTGQARSGRWPGVAVSGVGTQYEKPMVVAPLHGFDVRSPPEFDETLYQGHATAEYTLFDGGARRSRIRAAVAEAEAAASAVRAARDAVVADAVSSYLSALSAREVREAHRRQVTALSAERTRAQLLYEEGKAARVAVLRSEAALSEARAGLETVGEELRLALRRLARVSGLPAERIHATALVELSPRGLDVPPRDELVRRALDANPRLVEARDRVAAAGLAVGAARAAFLPRIDLSGRYSAFGSASTDPVLEWQTGVQVSYPLFTGGARAHGVERAEASAGAAEAELRQAERSVADGVDAALAAFQSARSRVAALEAAVDQSAEVARIEALALETGAGVQTDYLRAEAALLRARAGLAEARHMVVLARTRLARTTGELDERWVARLTEGAER